MTGLDLAVDEELSRSFEPRLIIIPVSVLVSMFVLVLMPMLN
jgi:hypothetical protein